MKLNTLYNLACNTHFLGTHKHALVSKYVAVIAPYDEYELDAKLNSKRWSLLKVWLGSCESSILITTHLEATE